MSYRCAEEPVATLQPWPPVKDNDPFPHPGPAQRSGRRVDGLDGQGQGRGGREVGGWRSVFAVPPRQGGSVAGGEGGKEDRADDSGWKAHEVIMSELS